MAGAVMAQAAEAVLGAGDVIKITVFQNPDMTLEARIPASGAVSYPLIGNVPIAGLTVSAAEERIAQKLRDGGFVRQPQVNILVTQLRSAIVSVLGQVNRPGTYPLDKPQRVSEMLATAGGIMPTGADTVIVTRTNKGHTGSSTIDIAKMYLDGDTSKDVWLEAGDVLYVHREPVFYIYGEVQKPGSYRLDRDMSVIQALALGFIYGEVQKPGSYRLDRDMSVIQALALGGGLTPRGTEKGLQVHRRDSSGKVKIFEPPLSEPLRANDVVYVKERLF
jgi:polysaccharide export outer membrane protein